ncbi:MAG TPA: protein-methionine-sulfoxide reductase heme-binding subunit MsrQ [Vicinamibacterales bacterium]|nr:protein-methionine-sulfoxide reductase heme-binding subunit MsrQ [Vicinamibacterales bacterium]
MSAETRIRWVVKPLVFAACLVPFGYLVWRAFTGDLTADPLTEVTNETGIWTLRFVVVTLALTPLRRVSGWNVLVRFRRMIGLFAFFYGSLHFLTYVVGDRFASLDFPDGFVAVSTLRNLVASIWEDIAKRPYITVGSIAFFSMIPLALTSTKGWIRRLGGRNWQRIHRLIYLTGIAGVTHYWWRVKADTLHPAVYAAIVVILLGFRLVLSLKRSRWQRPPVEMRA